MASTIASDYRYLEAPSESAQAVASSWIVSRWKWLFVLFVIPTSICGMSWFMGGIPLLTDFGFVLMLMVCLGLVINELIVFPRRFGFGGILLYLGSIAWFGYDYVSNWMGADFRYVDFPITKAVVAKAAFYYSLFLLFATIGLTLSPPKRTTRFLTKLPEANTLWLYLILVVISFLIGIAPYFLFVEGSPFTAIFDSILSGRTGMVKWTVGRTGNANYSWNAYVTYMINIGQVGSQLAVFYAVLLTRNLFIRLLCAAYWLLYVGFAFGTGTRGQIAFMVFPICVLYYLKYQYIAAIFLKRISLRAYIISGVIMLSVLVAFQIQATFRNIGFKNVDIKEVIMTKIQGNYMFSEGLVGWSMVPDHQPFLSNPFPGSGLILPIPNMTYYFVLGGIPRAMWNTKPFDPMNAWYNAVITGRSVDNPEGTTITPGIVTEWYCRYGILGVIQGAILFGWLCQLFERGLMANLNRPFGMLVSIGLGVVLFRFFRSFTPVVFYPLFIPLVFMGFLIFFFNLFVSRPQSETQA